MDNITLVIITILTFSIGYSLGCIQTLANIKRMSTITVQTNKADRDTIKNDIKEMVENFKRIYNKNTEIAAEKKRYKECPVCKMQVPLALGKIILHGTGSAFPFPCPGSQIGCLSPKNIEDMKKPTESSPPLNESPLSTTD